MTTFLSIQHTYHTVQAALFRDQKVIDIAEIGKEVAGKHIIQLLDNLLLKNNVQLDDISFIATNQGPGPFTTLRIVIASVNGLSFTGKIPLIGIDGLEAFLIEAHDSNYPNTVILLNAFNKDVYFTIENATTKKSEKGYKNIASLLTELHANMNGQKIRFIGNAVPLYRTEIENIFGHQAFIPDPVPHTCSIEQIGIMGFKQWQKNPLGVQQLLPLYLKKHPVQMNV